MSDRVFLDRRPRVHVSGKGEPPQRRHRKIGREESQQGPGEKEKGRRGEREKSRE